MATFKYFVDQNGETIELAANSIHFVGKQIFGSPVGFVPTYNGDGWNRGYVAATRTIRMKSNPSRHECDARCMFASGRTMNCECSCGGRNHGKGGGFRADAA